MAKVTKVGLQRSLVELEEKYNKRCAELSSIKMAVGLYSYDSQEKLIEKVQKLAELEEHKNMVAAEYRGVEKGRQEMEGKEVDKLWHLIRTMIGDPLLEKEAERTQENYSDRYGKTQERKIFITPFTKRIDL